MNVVDSLDGDTPLHGAAGEGHRDIVDYLLSLPDIDLRARNRKGKTAAMKARSKKHHEIADMIRAEVRCGGSCARAAGFSW